MKKLILISLVVLLCSTVIAQDEQNIILITNVNVWDGTSDKTIEADVLIEGNKFKEIKSAIKAPL